MCWLILFFLCPLVLGDNVEICGAPEQPSKGFIRPNKSLYHKGDVVTIRCHTGYYMQGSKKQVSRITCLGNEIWNRTIPSCNIRDYFLGKDVRSVPPSGTFRFNSTNHCKDFEFSNDKRMLELFITNVFDEDFNGTFQVLVEIGWKNADVQIELIVEYSVKSKPNSWIPCASEKYNNTKLDKTVLAPNCNIPPNKNPRDIHLFVKVQFPSKENVKKMEICSLKGFGLHYQGCGAPATPAYSNVSKSNSTASYSCEDGYELIGNKERTCEWTQEGYTWLPPGIPTCLSKSDNGRNAPRLAVFYVVLIIAATVVPFCVILFYLYRARKRKLENTEHIYESIDDLQWSAGRRFRNFLRMCRRHVFKLRTATTTEPVGQLQNQNPRHCGAQTQGQAAGGLPVSLPEQPFRFELHRQTSPDRIFLIDDSAIYADVNDLSSNNAANPTFDRTTSNHEPYARIVRTRENSSLPITSAVHFHNNQSEDVEAAKTDTNSQATDAPCVVEHYLKNDVLYSQVD